MHSVDKKKQDIKLIINSETMKGIVDFLLGEINPRSKLVLEMRFGLGGEKPRSLNFIGVKLNITRERVRQIEVDSFKRLKELKKTQEYEAVISRVIKIIDFHGGFCEKRKLKEEIKKNVNDLERSYLMIILNSSTRLKFEKANKRTEAFWFNEKTTNVKTVASCVEEIIKFMQTKKEPVKFDEILNSH